MNAKKELVIPFAVCEPKAEEMFAGMGYKKSVKGDKTIFCDMHGDYFEFLNASRLIVATNLMMLEKEELEACLQFMEEMGGDIKCQFIAPF